MNGRYHSIMFEVVRPIQLFRSRTNVILIYGQYREKLSLNQIKMSVEWDRTTFVTDYAEQ